MHPQRLHSAARRTPLALAGVALFIASLAFVCALPNRRPLELEWARTASPSAAWLIDTTASRISSGATPAEWLADTDSAWYEAAAAALARNIWRVWHSEARRNPAMTWQWSWRQLGWAIRVALQPERGGRSWSLRVSVTAPEQESRAAECACI